MAEFDFEDLTKGPGNELRGRSSSAEGASPRQTNAEMLLGGLAESVAQMVAFQVQQAARREEAEAKQEQQTKRAVEMHLELAREMGAHVKEMSMHVDQRFDALARSQEALPVGQQAFQKVVEVAGVAIALWKRKLALEEEKDND